MKYRLVVAFSTIFLIQPWFLSYGVESEVRIDTQVLAVFATKNSCCYHKPWKSPNFRSVRGSGFFFEDEKNFPGKKALVLTNAHVAAMAENLEVSNGREKRRYKLTPLGICNSADFAILQMEPKELKAYERRNGKIVPLELGDSDKLRVGDKVLGWGYPLGGERISKSEQGEINRIEVIRYAYSHESWLTVQTSLQQNPGNSGGPICKDGKVVGIAFQGVRASDRINYFIPINLVRSLMPLLDKQELIPRWRCLVQHMSPRLKEYYDLGPEDGGLLLSYVIPDGGPYKFGLRANDILLEIDGHKIDNFGDIFFEPIGRRIYFEEILNRKKVGDPLAIRVKRGGKAVEIHGDVTPGLPWLVPRIFSTANYFICAGIGFVELTYNCIADLGKSGLSLKEKHLREPPKLPNQKIVVIAEVFPEYGLVNTAPYLLKRLEKINGHDVLNIEHLFSAIRSLKKKGEKKALIEISRNIQLPLHLEQAEKLDNEIKRKYGILYMKTPGGFSK